MKSILLAALFVSLPAPAASRSPASHPPAEVASRDYARCMLDNARTFSARPGSPDALGSQLDEFCSPKYKQFLSLVRADLARHFRGRRNVNVDTRARMMAEWTRGRLKRTAVAEISKIRFGY